jgi:hypothetical protein
MDRSEALWKTWYTQPLPNIGLMLCRGNKKTVKMFELAWKDYQVIKNSINKCIFLMSLVKFVKLLRK